MEARDEKDGRPYPERNSEEDVFSRPDAISIAASILTTARCEIDVILIDEGFVCIEDADFILYVGAILRRALNMYFVTCIKI